MAQRTPLGEINTNSRRGTEVNAFDRGKIALGAHLGMSAVEIGKLVDRAPRTVRSIKERLKTSPTAAPKKRAGRPKVFTDQDERAIVRVVRKDPTVNYLKITFESGVKCCRNTIKKILKKHGLQHWIQKKRPFLKPRHAKARLRWCIERKDWSKDEWSLIIFSDECSLERGSGRRRHWVWGYPAEKWSRERVTQVKKGKDISFMIWGAIWIGGRSDLVFMERDIESKRQGYSARSYQAVLNDQLPRCYQPGMIFQQDNAGIHVAGFIDDWFADHGVIVEDWPAYSPDLNPIEHLWALIKTALNEKHPHLCEMGRSIAALAEFQDAIALEWHAIDQEVIDELIKSMDYRVNEVMAAKGWHTRY